MLLGCICQAAGDLLLGKTLVQLVDLQVDDLGDVVLGQGLVEDNLVQTVQELGAEALAQQHHDPLLGSGVNFAVVTDAAQQLLRAQVGGQDQNGVLEVHGAALGVGDPAVVQHLQQDVEHIGMGLLHLVEQHHAVGLSADGLGQLAAFLVAHVSGRRADQTADGEFLHVFGHIDPHQVVLVVKQGFCQRLGKLRLAHACGAQEQEGTDGPVGVLDACTAALDGLGHGLDGLILANHTLVEDAFQVQQLLPLPLDQTADGNARPALHDLGDFLVGDLLVQQSTLAFGLVPALLFLQLLLQLGQASVFQLCGLAQVVALLGRFDLAVQVLNVLTDLLDLFQGILFVFPLGLLGVEAFLLLGQLLAKLGQAALGQLVLFLLQGLLLNLQLDDVAVHAVQLRGHGVLLGPQLGTGLIDQVDGLVRQETVGDIPVGKGSGGDNGGVCDLHAVEVLIALLQATENGDGVLHRGLIDHDGLETALQSGIFFNILPVFVQGRCADAVQLAPGQHRLQEVAGIHAALGLAGTHNGVQLIDEQQNFALGLLDLVQNGL